MQISDDKHCLFTQQLSLAQSSSL